MHLWLQGGATADAPAAPALPRPVPESVTPEREESRPGLLRRAVSRPELLLLLALAAALNLWSLDTNGWANDYYSAAVRSMTESWHNFLFGSFDPAGVMTVDKPPLALWVQALSARAFGLSSWSILVPQAVMGVAAVGFTWDLTRRRFGRVGGFVAGLALAITPTAVAIFRHNNPDAVVLLCSVVALWAVVRALEDGRTRWLVLAGAMIGLGFEAKMGAALLVVPALAAAYLWVSPRGYLASLRQLLAGLAALVVVGGIWPLLVALTPASDRPYISGTDDNSIWSLILGYNGLGRLAGQAGGPGGAAGGPGGGGGGGVFGGTTGPFRLLNEALGPQGAWLVGFALVGGIGIAVASRLRRSDARTGWIIATGGAALTMAVAFSYASGIFHPYYVSLLAPFTAALVGGTAAELLRGGTIARVVAPVAIAVGVAVELVVVDRAGNLDWLPPVLVVVGAATAATLAIVSAPGIRAGAVALFLAAALVGPAIWSVQTLGHATSGTFPAGGPASAGGGFGGPGGARRWRRRPRRLRRRPGRSPDGAPAGWLRRRRDVRRLVEPHRGPRLHERQRRRDRRRLQPAGRLGRHHPLERRRGRHRRLLRPRERAERVLVRPGGPRRRHPLGADRRADGRRHGRRRPRRLQRRHDRGRERVHRDPLLGVRGHHLRQHELERALRLPWQGRRAG